MAAMLQFLLEKGKEKKETHPPFYVVMTSFVFLIFLVFVFGGLSYLFEVVPCLT